MTAAARTITLPRDAYAAILACIDIAVRVTLLGGRASWEADLTA